MSSFIPCLSKKTLYMISLILHLSRLLLWLGAPSLLENAPHVPRWEEHRAYFACCQVQPSVAALSRVGPSLGQWRHRPRHVASRCPAFQGPGGRLVLQLFLGSSLASLLFAPPVVHSLSCLSVLWEKDFRTKLWAKSDADSFPRGLLQGATGQAK